MKLRILASLLVLMTASAPVGAQIQVEKTANTVQFVQDGKLLTEYHIGPKVAKPYFWPVMAPGQVPVTRAWPMEKATKGGSTDHVHQKSLWFCHGDVIPEGIQLKVKIPNVAGVDYWAEHPGHGHIVCTNVKIGSTGGEIGKVVTSNEWLTPKGQKILDETRTITVKPMAEGWLLVLDCDLAASVCPITFGDTKEGSMGVRVNDQLTERKGGVLTNDQGKQKEKNLWGRQARWCDYSGKVDGEEVGIAIFDAPSNSVQACWHARGYGLLAANPFGRQRSRFPDRKGQTDLVKLDKGEHLKLRYGVYVHTGDVESGKVAEAFTAFAE